jgi:GNAT superfamily N-acetyltransferase
MSNIHLAPRTEILHVVYTDYRSEMVIVGTLPAAHGEDIIAVGCYYLDSQTNRAEVAFLVHDEWQNRGIGTYLLKYLITVAKRNGITGFTAEVLPDNGPMQAVLNKSNCKMRRWLEEGTNMFDLDFTQ